MTETESVLLERCPMCLYQLEGLPIRTSCPECGFEVDRCWRVFGGRVLHARRAKKRLAVLVIGLPLILYLLVVVSWAHGPKAIVIPYILMFAWPVLIFFRPPRGFIVVGPQGIVTHVEKEGRTSYEWPDFVSANLDLMERCVRLRLHGRDDAKLKTWTFFRSNLREADACIRAIHSESGRWAPQPM